jgi:hypothetical protein
MSILSGIPKGAIIAINDMLDNCAKVQPGQEVLLLAHIDGLYGGDNLIDHEAVTWIQAVVQFKGANASVLWIDENAKPDSWRMPPIVKGAVAACDIFINNSFDITWEEITELKQLIKNLKKVIMVRNFATTAPLLCTAWAQTPYELVSEIRYQASFPFKEGLTWHLTDDNGTCLEGKISPAFIPKDNIAPPKNLVSYSQRREEYRPWPEWVHRPIELSNTSGVFIFDSMLSWWSRYIGISPYFSRPIRLNVENNKIIKIEGGDEAEKLSRFLDSMREQLGNGVYDFSCLHFGVHPQANVGPHECPNILYRRLIEHSHSSTIHFHVGAPSATPSYPYWMHCTGDIRTATFRVGDTIVHDRGHLTVLDSPAIKAIAAKYPDRPGLDPQPRSF